MNAVLDSPSVTSPAPQLVPPMLPEAPLPVDAGQLRHRKLRVGIVVDHIFPGNDRLECISRTLVDGGYEVHLLCVLPFMDGLTPGNYSREEYFEGVYVHRVNPDQVTFDVPFLNKQTRLPYTGVIQSLSTLLLNRDNTWYTLMDRFVQFYGIDILHVNNLRMLDTGLTVAKKHRCPIMVDLPEHYPAVVAQRTSMNSIKQGLFESKVLNHWEKIEERGVERVDHVFVSTEEGKRRLLDMDVLPSKITVLSNTFDIEKYATMPQAPDIMRQFKPWFLMTFAGSIVGEHQGLQTVLDALVILKPEIPELFFVAAGELKGLYRQQLQAKIAELGLQQRVYLTCTGNDNDPQSDFIHYVAASDICLLPHNRCDITEVTFPQSAYLYHLFKKPIVASDCQPVECYVRESHGGLVFPSGNADELANEIRRLYYDTELKKVMGENGQHAVLNRYNWPAHANTLLAAYQNLVDERALSRI